MIYEESQIFYHNTLVLSENLCMLCTLFYFTAMLVECDTKEISFSFIRYVRISAFRGRPTKKNKYINCISCLYVLVTSLGNTVSSRE